MPATYGADPEFVIADEFGALIPAHNLLSTSMTAEVGTDGCSSTGEMRPQPGTATQVFASVASLVDRLRNTIRPRYANAHVHAGAYAARSPLGGHIHISGVDHGILTGTVFPALDRLVTVPLQGVTNTAERQARSYGQLGEFRIQPHGGLEYRSVPSWISHPDIARGVLRITELLTEAAITQVPITTTLELETKDPITVRRFYNRIEIMRRTGQRLEEVDVLDAWDPTVDHSSDYTCASLEAPLPEPMLRTTPTPRSNRTISTLGVGEFRITGAGTTRHVMRYEVGPADQWVTSDTHIEHIGQFVSSRTRTGLRVTVCGWAEHRTTARVIVLSPDLYAIWIRWPLTRQLNNTLVLLGSELNPRTIALSMRYRASITPGTILERVMRRLCWNRRNTDMRGW